MSPRKLGIYDWGGSRVWNWGKARGGGLMVVVGRKEGSVIEIGEDDYARRGVGGLLLLCMGAWEVRRIGYRVGTCGFVPLSLATATAALVAPAAADVASPKSSLP
ncbi:hypothetical protein Sjap_010436 [Stephania japonica]|uniref:Uncharacterized protein n=1 Tax=Stephania japonica TaxID=461633 RepID=A0AAP0J9K6_9MAGN